jgi:2-dehydro-3-deoxyphosphooctonate aldolase (KDO 8-P synthase)
MLASIPKLKNLESNNFLLIAGPCAIEGEEMAFEIAEKIQDICQRLEIPFVFKGSYKKANRTRLDSFTGIGDEKALKILKAVGERLRSGNGGGICRHSANPSFFMSTNEPLTSSGEDR